MGDLFHESVPDEWIDRVFAVMALAPQHIFQVLTKRSKRMREYLGTRAGDWNIVWPDANPPGSLPISRHEQRLAMRGAGWPDAILQPTFPLPNVWLGVSAEDQRRADERVPDLLATPAAVRFASAEPLLAMIDFTALNVSGDAEMNALAPLSWREVWSRHWSPEATGVPLAEAIEAYQDEGGVYPPTDERGARLDWIIVGGESGPRARPTHPDWARSIRDQCAAAGVPFFFKQWGEWAPGDAFGLVEDGPVHDRQGNVKDHMNRYAICADRADRFRGHSFTGHATNLVYRVGKRRAGRLLDGREHSDLPTAAAEEGDRR